MTLRVVYEPRGRAGEYASLACNLYSGCDHGCTYCYAPKILRKTREQFRSPAPRAGILDKLQRDARELQDAGETRPILLCFTCDPYQQCEEYYRTTRAALKILLDHDQNITILTKGGYRSQRDFDIVADHTDQVTYATSLIFVDETARQRYEPGATPTSHRIAALEEAHELGVTTWVSLEPVFYPGQTIELIHDTAGIVDLYKVGKLNYMQEAKDVDWIAFAHEVVDVLDELGCDYYIKGDLRKFM